MADIELKSMNLPNDNNTYWFTDKDAQDKIDSSLESVSGNPISITGLKSSQLAVNPVIIFEPIQDLHGQSKSYPAGGGKNKLNADDYYDSYKQTDGSYRATGGTFNGIKIYATSDMIGNTYTFSAYLDLSKETSPTNALTKRAVNGVGTNGTLINSGEKGVSSVTFTPTSTSDYVFITYGTGSDRYFTASNLQIEAGETATAYAPYENICPISGYDKIEVLSGNKNVITEIEQGSWDKSTGTKTTGSTRCRSIRMYPLGSSQYVLSVASNVSGKTAMVVVHEYVYSNGTFVNTFDSGWQNSGYTFTATAGMYYAFVFGFTDNSNVTPASFKDVQLETGQTTTTYAEPHKTTDLSESLGQTVYGGSLNIRSGKLTKTWGIITFDGYENWAEYDGGYYYSIRGFAQAEITGAIANRFAYSTAKTTGTFRGLSGGGSYTPLFYYSGVSSLQDWIYWLRDNPITFVYPLATSIEIQLTPHEIPLAQGYAYLSTNGTLIQLAYHNGEMARLADVEQLSETVEKGFALFPTFGFPKVEIADKGVTSSSSYSLDLTTLKNNLYLISAIYTTGGFSAFGVLCKRSDTWSYQNLYTSNRITISLSGTTLSFVVTSGYGASYVNVVALY